MQLHRFASRDEMARALAARAAVVLEQALAQRGQALLALSGGSTPALYLPLLDKRVSGWDRIDVTLVDDRWVPADHADSNEGLIRRLLPRARLSGLVTAAADPAAGLDTVRRRLEALPHPWDLALLGMGADGHVASLFPGTGAPENPDPLCCAVAGAPLHPRISLSAAALASFRQRLLAVTGRDKLEILSRAEREDGLPVSLLLRDQGPLEVYWAE